MPTKHNKTFLRALIEATDYGVLMTDVVGTDLISNMRFNVIFGISPDSVGTLPRDEMRRLALQRVKDPDGFSAVMDRVYADPELEFEDEIDIIVPSDRILRRHTAPVRSEDGAIVGRIWTFLDVTDTHRLQKEVASYATHLEEKLTEQARELQSVQEMLIESTRMRAVGSLATGIAHDLRNILTGLKLELAMFEPSPRVDLVGQQFDRLYALTHSLLSLSQDQEPHSGPVDIQEVIDFVFRLVQSQADIDGVSLLRNAPHNLPPVLGNPRRLEHLFINLVLNALNAMSLAGGVLNVNISQEGQYIRLDLVDTGHGIPEHLQPRLFEPFFTTRANRSGLGLFAVQRIVDAHNGKIGVSSDPGSGACVTVRLPCVLGLEVDESGYRADARCEMRLPELNREELSK